MNRKFKNVLRNLKGKLTRDYLSYYQIYFELEEGGQQYHTVIEAYSEEQAIAKLEDEINAGYPFRETNNDWIVYDDRGLFINRYSKGD